MQLPNVQIVGDTTEGILSDMQFFSSKMINYEGIGIEPDYYIVNSKKDIENGVDPVLEKALNLPLWNTRD